MSIVVRLPDDVVDLINDVKLIMLNDIDHDIDVTQDLAYQIISNMNRIDIIRHCLRSVKSMHSEKECFSGTTTEKHVTRDGNC